jgi:hypothetical protein
MFPLLPQDVSLLKRSAVEWKPEEEAQDDEGDLVATAEMQGRAYTLLLLLLPSTDGSRTLCELRSDERAMI